MNSNEQLKIMVVEDETLLLEAITKKLEIEGISSIACLSGSEAFEKLKDKENLPSIIWLDFHLKDMNGLEFMKILKGDPDWSKIPVVVITNSVDDVVGKELLELGVTKYLLKADYKLDDLISIVKETI